MKFKFSPWSYPYDLNDLNDFAKTLIFIKISLDILNNE
jgi:hypothetical protein